MKMYKFCVTRWDVGNKNLSAKQIINEQLNEAVIDQQFLWNILIHQQTSKLTSALEQTITLHKNSRGIFCIQKTTHIAQNTKPWKTHTADKQIHKAKHNNYSRERNRCLSHNT